jgi:hypothetical protein
MSNSESQTNCGSSHGYLDLVLVKDGDEWIAQGDIPGAKAFVFVGTGRTQAEAIGSFMMNNREELRFTVGMVGEDGNVKLSTVFGKPRSAGEMGPNEKKYLSR